MNRYVAQPFRAASRRAGLKACATAFAILLETTAQAAKSDVADAVMKGDAAALRALLQQKADVNAP